MAVHVFVDESQRGCYYLVGTLVTPDSLVRTRRLLRSLLLRGERRIHFKAESDSRRRLILSRPADAGVKACVYRADGTNESVRANLLVALVTEILDRGATRLVMDSRDSAANSRDRSTIANNTKARVAGLRYEHVQSSQEEILWVSDAIAWSYGAGKDWRRRVSTITEQVVHLNDVG